MTRAWLVRRPSLVLLVALSMVATMVGAASANPSSDEARAMLQRAEERLDQLEGEFHGVVDDYNEAVERLEQAQEQVAEAEAELARLRAENDALSTAAANHVRQLHKYGPTIEMTTMLGSPDPSAASNTAATLRRVLLGQQADLQSLTATRTSLEAAEQRLLDDQQQAERHAEAVEVQRDRIQATFEEQADEVSELEDVLASAIAREEAERRAREEAAARAAAEQRRQERLAQERARQQAQQTQQTEQTQQTQQAQPQQTSTKPAPAPRANAQVAVDAALSKLGSPYRWGATGPNAFDCSGLMVWAWAQAGVSLPRTSAGQFANLRRISRSELQPGDLVFAGSPRVHHVGMYIGNGQIVHSPRSGYTVSIRSMERSDLRGFARPG